MPDRLANFRAVETRQSVAPIPTITTNAPHAKNQPGMPLPGSMAGS
jgi:hypothetical protein